MRFYSTTSNSFSARSSPPAAFHLRAPHARRGADESVALLSSATPHQEEHHRHRQPSFVIVSERKGMDSPVGGATPATAAAADDGSGRIQEHHEEEYYDEYPVARVLHPGTPTPSRCVHNETSYMFSCVVSKTIPHSPPPLPLSPSFPGRRHHLLLHHLNRPWGCTRRRP